MKELILIVEDHALNRKLVRDVLRAKGYTIEYLITSPYVRRYGDGSVTLPLA